MSQPSASDSPGSHEMNDLDQLVRLAQSVRKAGTAGWKPSSPTTLKLFRRLSQLPSQEIWTTDELASLVMGYAQWSPSSTKTTEVLRSHSKDKFSWSQDQLAALVVGLTHWEPPGMEKLAVLQAQAGWEEKLTWTHEELVDMIGHLVEQDQEVRDAWVPTDSGVFRRLDKLRKRFRSNYKGGFTPEELATIIGKLVDDYDKKKKSGLILTKSDKALLEADIVIAQNRGANMGRAVGIIDGALNDSERMRRDLVAENEDLVEENEKLQANVNLLKKLQKKRVRIRKDLSQKLGEATATQERERVEAKMTLEKERAEAKVILERHGEEAKAAMDRELEEAKTILAKERETANAILEQERALSRVNAEKQLIQMKAQVQEACGVWKQEKDELKAQMQKLMDEKLNLEKQHDSERIELESERDEAMVAARQSLKRKFDDFMLEHSD
ncbi:hypothetical protein FKW77_005789 [Venturia effusa]|uniref:Uncharacterized protein n=1 Tax=Venturia effusa TaxID=50376 RepID=A0A517L5H7_9PEZI|nr:hypothetical protein FKW77_005789 [Venturia effusa]